MWKVSKYELNSDWTRRSECGKIRTRKNSVLGHFSCSVLFWKCYKLNIFTSMSCKIISKFTWSSYKLAFVSTEVTIHWCSQNDLFWKFRKIPINIAEIKFVLRKCYAFVLNLLNAMSSTFGLLLEILRNV